MTLQIAEFVSCCVFGPLCSVKNRDTELQLCTKFMFFTEQTKKGSLKLVGPFDLSSQH